MEENITCVKITHRIIVVVKVKIFEEMNCMRESALFSTWISIVEVLCISVGVVTFNLMEENITCLCENFTEDKEGGKLEISEKMNCIIETAFFSASILNLEL